MEKQKEVYGIIYVIRNKVNNKLYIGQTTNKKGFNGRYHFKGQGIEKVYNFNKYSKDKNKNYNAHLLRSIEKYGFKAFEVIEEFDVAYSKEELNKLEYMYIEIYETRNFNYGYNIRYGGNNGKLSEETKRKIKENHVDNSGENNGFYGKHHTEETKRKISENSWMKGKKGELSPNYGKHLTEETKQKLREANLGKHLTEETKKKISEIGKGKNTKEKNGMFGKTGGKSPVAKAIYCYEFDEIRLSAMDWVRELNFKDNSGIIACCKGRYKQTQNYHFRYATEEEIKEYKLKHGIEE